MPDYALSKPLIGYIYIIVNKLNGLYYIGKREKLYFDEAYWGSGIVISRLIKKYGKDSFIRNVLEWVYGTHNDICECEKKWISLLDSTNIKRGYNLTQGGEGFASGKLNPNFGRKHSMWTEKGRQCFLQKMKGRKFSEEHKQHMSESFKGKKVSKESREKMSLSWNYEKHITQQFRDKCSKARKNKKFSYRHSKNISIGVKKYHKENPKVWVNDGKKSYIVLISELQNYLDNGYFKGRILNINERVWINNGQIEKYIKKEDLNKYLNWNTGRKNSVHNLNKKCINNGEHNKFVFEEELESYFQNGWKLGIFRNNKKEVD